MDECEDNLSAEEIQYGDSSPAVRIKPKKRSLVERELETNLTARVTSPVTAEGASTSRYGRARRSTHISENDAEKVMKPLKIDTKPQPQAYKMHASNSPIRKDSPKRPISSTIEDQIENIYNENMALSRFGQELLSKGQSPAKKSPKIYIRKDLTQKPEADDVVLIKNLFSPAKSNTHLNNILERSSEKYNGHATTRNGFPENSSVVKILDFDGKKKKKEVKEIIIPKNELFELEAGSEYQVGDLAWARVGTYPFWPCIVTREPFTDMFAKKKLFGRVEHYIIHVIFFGDNGRRGWIVDNMLRKYYGRAEFESARQKFTLEAKKKDPRLYAAYFVSEKKLPLWNISVEEAETLLREPKRLRIDILYDMLEKARSSKTTPKREKGGKITRTDSDVSLSESLYDTLFSEDDNKNDDKNSKKSNKKSLDVSEVVTACLDNMAAKSGITKIQKQSHMDRWLQKAKSKTPEKSQPKLRIKNDVGRKRDRIRKPKESRKSKRKNESVSSEKNLLAYQNEHDYSSVNYENHDGSNINTDFDESGYNDTLNSSGLGIVVKVESLSSMEDSQEDIITTVVSDDIVITDAENISKEINVMDTSNIDKIITKDEETKLTSFENIISSTENEQKLTEDEPLKANVPKPDNIQTRRSQRKQQSLDTNDDKNIPKYVEETKVTSVENCIIISIKIEENQTKDEQIKDTEDESFNIEVPKTDGAKIRRSNRKSVKNNDDDKVIVINLEETKRQTSVENDDNSSNEIEQKGTKDEQTKPTHDESLKEEVMTTDTTKMRRSQRKSQLVENNVSKDIETTEIIPVENVVCSTEKEEHQMKDEPLKVEVSKTDVIISVENSITSTEVEEELTKDEPLKYEVPKTVGIKTRHGKIKPHSVNVNDDKITTKNVEEKKVENNVSLNEIGQKQPKDEQTKRKNVEEKKLENNVSVTGIGQKQPKDEQTKHTQEEPLTDEALITDGIKKRHSKRKSRSLHAKHDDKISTNNVEETKLENNISCSEIEQKQISDKINGHTQDGPFKNDVSKTDGIKTRHKKKKSHSLDVDDTKIITKSVEESKVTSVENFISSTETEEKLTKDEPLKVEVPKTDNIQTRLSMRKSHVNANDDKFTTNDANETKIISVETRITFTEINEKLPKDEPSKHTKDEPFKIEVSKTDAIQTRRSKRKRLSLEDKNNTVVENKAKNAKIFDLKSNTDNSALQSTASKGKKNDVWYQNKLISMNGPKPVVVIEPLKMLCLRQKLKSKEIIENPLDGKNDDSLLKNNDEVKIDETVIEKTFFQLEMSEEIIIVPGSKQVIKSEYNIDPNDTTIVVNGNSKNVNNKLTDSDMTENVVEQNCPFYNGISLSPEKENGTTDEMDVDTEILNSKYQVDKIQSNDLNSEISPDMTYTKIQTEKENTVENNETEIKDCPKLESENNTYSKENDANEGTSVVIGEEMYVFDRTLSQDYDEVYEDSMNENHTPPVASEFMAENDSSSIKNGDIDLNNDVALSQDYDEVIDSTENVNDAEIVEIPEANDLPGEVRNETLTDTIDKDMITNDVTENENLDKINEPTDTDRKKEENLDIEDKSKLTNDKDLPKNDQENKTEHVEQHMKLEETDNSNGPLKERIAKKLKSPRLSLNRAKRNSTKVYLKSQSENDSINNVTESDNIGVSEELNNETNKSEDGDVKIKKTEDTVVVKPDPDNPIEEVTIDKEVKSDNKMNGFIKSKESSPERKLKEEIDPETASIKSEDSGVSITRRKIRNKDKQSLKKAMDDPEFMKYLELRQDALIDEQPELTRDEIVAYLYQTWLYEESNKSEMKKTDEAEQSNIVKGLNTDPASQPKKIRKKPKVEKEPKAEKEPKVDIKDLNIKDKPKRKITQTKPYYNEDFSDLEEEDLETFSIFDTEVAQNENGEPIDEVELYFERLTKPKPNVFKGYVRERVCEICERTENLVKCKGCHGMFHVECTEKEVQIVEVAAPTRGRKKKKKPRGRKPKGYEETADYESQSDERSQDANISEELNASLEDEPESHITFDADFFETQWEMKMKEVSPESVGDFVSDQEIIWDAPPGQCEIVEMKHKEKPVDYSNFKCKDCQKHDIPVCFVCKSAKSPKGEETRQKCQVAHCHRHYHMECLEYWPQTQLNSWEPSKTNKKVIEYVEALSCPRHVCHTCVSDDPRGCKTRFCGDKLARCVRCPATYHSFTKCLPAGSQILTASQIICPRHYEHRSGKVPCHVNTGWCFICALGGTLICCEYCPTSFHAECLNIKPPEGNYMCEDCETGRLPLYGEMVWVKLGHYRWWPGIILHPAEIPENIMAVKHSPGEFVVRFFGQYDHYWVNRGRVFPFQEGDSGKISSQKSKIDAAFTTAMEHAQRACEILKNMEPNEEEDMDIASSLLPPHYVKLKVNKPVGSLVARRDIDSNSLTQCECDVTLPEPCGVYSHCLNRMLLTECGPLCRAGDRCNNRAFEKRQYPRLTAARTSSRGWGLKTLEDIKQGQFVIEYVGELIDEEEFRRRMCRKHEIRDENYYFLTLDKERMIDAGPKGNLARFMNHCCEPNCETQKWTVLGDVRVGLFALRDIPANSELTFNYNLECAGIEKKRCLCGAKRCSGYIGAKPKQEEAQPKKLKGPGKRTYKKRKNVEDLPSTSKIKPPVKIKIKPIKPKELTEIEKDLLIIKSATNGMSSDSEGSRLSSVDERKDTKPLKRKRVSLSTEEAFSVKKTRLDDKEGD